MARLILRRNSDSDNLLPDTRDQELWKKIVSKPLCGIHVKFWTFILEICFSSFCYRLTFQSHKLVKNWIFVISKLFIVGLPPAPAEEESVPPSSHLVNHFKLFCHLSPYCHCYCCCFLLFFFFWLLFCWSRKIMTYRYYVY